MESSEQFCCNFKKKIGGVGVSLYSSIKRSCSKAQPRPETTVNASVKFSEVNKDELISATGDESHVFTVNDFDGLGAIMQNVCSVIGNNFFGLALCNILTHFFKSKFNKVKKNQKI